MFSWNTPGAPLVVVAHRGASAHAPENTLASFRRAVKDGADAVELDVRLTADGAVVVIHDASLRRTANQRRRVDASTLAEVQALDAGGWFDARHAGEHIPTLSEVFGVVPTTKGINVELKGDRSGSRGAELVKRTCQIILRSHRAESVLVTSFHHALIALVKKHFPIIPAGILLHPFQQSARSPVRLARSIGAEYIVFGSRTLTKRLTEQAHREGLRVAEYTVNTEHRLMRAKRYGVDAIITNQPGAMKRRSGYGVV